MATMIPAICDGKVRPQSEVMVFQELQCLDNSWTIFHSFDYVSRDLNKTRWEGEIDFLLHHSRHGLLVLEVKGGQISYHDGVWYQDGRQIDPFGQARKNKYAVISLLSRLLGTAGKIPLGLKVAHAVCFPACGGNKFWPAEAEGLVATGPDVPYLNEFAVKVLVETRLPQGAELFPVDSGKVNKALRPYFDYGIHLFERLSVEEKQIFTYTQMQCAILDALDNFTHLQIQGCAGSGKTVMAVKKAIQLAEQGKQVLLLCYNQLLAEHLKKATEQYPGITAMAFFDFAIEKIGTSANEAAEGLDRQEFWQDELPQKLHDYLECVRLSYDAVIVDEGQDFSATVWIVIEKLVSRDGHFYIFFDPDQNLYQDELALPKLAYPPVALNKNCRNTRKIFAALKPYSANPKLKIVDGAPDGAEVLEYIEPDPELRRKKLSEILSNLLTKERLHSRDIVILGGHSPEKSCIGDDMEVGKYRIVIQPSTAPNEIYYCTYMKFKGCEAKAVILLDVSPDDPRWQHPRALYTAMSRARHMLVIIRK